jgi:hypothetical protein
VGSGLLVVLWANSVAEKHNAASKIRTLNMIAGPALRVLLATASPALLYRSDAFG